MLNIYFRPHAVRPAGIASYIDKLHVWLMRPLTRSEISVLSTKCRGGLHVGKEPARFDPAYRQLLQLHRPTREALEMLAARNDTYLNYLEIALDWIFADEEEADDAFWLLDRYHVKRHHRRQRVAYAGEGRVTRYTGPRRAPNVMVTYADRPSKATGELHCVHLEWRIRSASALRGAGIASVADVLRLRPRLFWLNRLLLDGIDVAQLGRLYHAHFRRGRRLRKSARIRRERWVQHVGRHGFAFDMDARIGGTIQRALGSTQAVIDAYGPIFGSKLRERCLIAMDDKHLLPGWGASFL